MSAYGAVDDNAVAITNPVAIGKEQQHRTSFDIETRGSFSNKSDEQVKELTASKRSQNAFPTEEKGLLSGKRAKSDFLRVVAASLLLAAVCIAMAFGVYKYAESQTNGSPSSPPSPPPTPEERKRLDNEATGRLFDSIKTKSTVDVSDALYGSGASDGSSDGSSSSGGGSGDGSSTSTSVRELLSSTLGVDKVSLNNFKPEYHETSQGYHFVTFSATSESSMWRGLGADQSDVAVCGSMSYDGKEPVLVLKALTKGTTGESYDLLKLAGVDGSQILSGIKLPNSTSLIVSSMERASVDLLEALQAKGCISAGYGKDGLHIDFGLNVGVSGAASHGNSILDKLIAGLFHGQAPLFTVTGTLAPAFSVSVKAGTGADPLGSSAVLSQDGLQAYQFAKDWARINVTKNVWLTDVHVDFARGSAGGLTIKAESYATLNALFTSVRESEYNTLVAPCSISEDSGKWKVKADATKAFDWALPPAFGGSSMFRVQTVSVDAEVSPQSPAKTYDFQGSFSASMTLVKNTAATFALKASLPGTSGSELAAFEVDGADSSIHLFDLTSSPVPGSPTSSELSAKGVFVLSLYKGTFVTSKNATKPVDIGINFEGELDVVASDLLKQTLSSDLLANEVGLTVSVSGLVQPNGKFSVSGSLKNLQIGDNVKLTTAAITVQNSDTAKPFVFLSGNLDLKDIHLGTHVTATTTNVQVQGSFARSSISFIGQAQSSLRIASPLFTDVVTSSIKLSLDRDSAAKKLTGQVDALITIKGYDVHAQAQFPSPQDGCLRFEGDLKKHAALQPEAAALSLATTLAGTQGSSMAQAQAEFPILATDATMGAAFSAPFVTNFSTYNFRAELVVEPECGELMITSAINLPQIGQGETLPVELKVSKPDVATGKREYAVAIVLGQPQQPFTFSGTFPSAPRNHALDDAPLINAAVSFSTAPQTLTFPGMGITTPVSLKKGFSFLSQLDLSSQTLNQCAAKDICKALKVVAGWGFQTMELQATISDLSSFLLEASASGNVRVGDLAHFTSTGVFLQVSGTTVKVGLTTDFYLQLKEENLAFSDKLYVQPGAGTVSVGISSAMNNALIDAFGVKGLTIDRSELDFAMGCTLTDPPVCAPTTVGVGTGLHYLGVGGSGDVYVELSNGAAGTGVLVYAEVDGFNLKSLINKALAGMHIDANYQGALFDIRFNHTSVGVNMISHPVTFNGRSWPAQSYSVHAVGFNLFETFKGSAAVDVYTGGAKTGLRVAATLGPVNVGGWLQLGGARSFSDPMLLDVTAMSSPSPAFAITANCGIEIAGQYLATKMDVNALHINLFVNVSMLHDLFDFTLNLQEQGGVKHPSDFSVDGQMNQEVLDWMSSKLKTLASDSHTRCTTDVVQWEADLQQHQNAVVEKEAKIAQYKAEDDATLNDMEKEVAKWQGEVKHAESKVNGLQSKIDSEKSKIHALHWYQRYKEPYYLAIIAGLEIAKTTADGALELANAALSAAEKVIRDSGGVVKALDPRIDALRVEVAVEEAAIELANRTLHKLGYKMCGAVEKMENGIATFVGKAFNIERLRVTGSLKQLKAADLADVQATGYLLGHHFDTSFSLDFKLLEEMAGKLYSDLLDWRKPEVGMRVNLDEE